MEYGYRARRGKYGNNRYVRIRKLQEKGEPIEQDEDEKPIPLPSDHGKAGNPADQTQNDAVGKDSTTQPVGEKTETNDDAAGQKGQEILEPGIASGAATDAPPDAAEAAGGTDGHGAGTGSADSTQTGSEGDTGSEPVGEGDAGTNGGESDDNDAAGSGDSGSEGDANE